MSYRKLVVYISMSLDGFLASKDDDLSFLSVVEKPGEDYGYADFTNTVDTYIVGRQTYDVVKKMVGNFPPAKHFKCYVITREPRAPEDGVTFYNGDISALINSIRAEQGKNIYCDGGGQIVKLLLETDLIDELIVSVIPVILGDGKRLFIGETPKRDLIALPPRHFDTGLTQLRYQRKR